MREADARGEEVKATYELEMRLVKQKAGLQVAKKELAFVELERRYAKLEARFDDVANENERRIVRRSKLMWMRSIDGLFLLRRKLDQMHGLSRLNVQPQPRL